MPLTLPAVIITRGGDKAAACHHRTTGPDHNPIGVDEKDRAGSAQMSLQGRKLLTCDPVKGSATAVVELDRTARTDGEALPVDYPARGGLVDCGGGSCRIDTARTGYIGTACGQGLPTGKAGDKGGYAKKKHACCQGHQSVFSSVELDVEEGLFRVKWVSSEQ